MLDPVQNGGKASMFCRCYFEAFLEDLRSQSPIIAIFLNRSCVQSTEHLKALEHTRTVSGENSCLAGDKISCVWIQIRYEWRKIRYEWRKIWCLGENPVKTGKKYCMDTKQFVMIWISEIDFLSLLNSISNFGICLLTLLLSLETMSIFPFSYLYFFERICNDLL